MGIQPKSSARIHVTAHSDIFSTRDQGQYYLIKPLLWILCGSATDFLGKVIYQLTEAASGANLEFSFITAFILAILTYVSCIVPTMLSAETRKSIRSIMTWKIFFKLMVPSWMSLLVTSSRYCAIILVSPSVVSITKTSVQVVTLTIISMCFRKNFLTRGQVLAILCVLMGNAVVFVSSILCGFDSSIGKTGDAYFGLILAALSGFLGGIRNITEEILLQNHGITSKGLILVETSVTLLTASITGATLVKVLKPNLYLYFNTWTTPGVIPVLCTFMCTMYLKQYGKYHIMKVSNAITAKIVSLVFPFGIWTLSLLTYHCITEGNRHPVGQAWHSEFSALRLLGFIIIVGSVWLFQSAEEARKLTRLTFRSTYNFSDARLLLFHDSESVVN